MRYVNSMTNNDLDNVVKQIADLLSPSIQKDFVNKQSHSVEKRYDDLGIDVVFSQALGFPNTSSMTIVHPDYTVSYNRMWPAFDNGAIRITGTATTNYTGDCTPIQDLLTFLKLRQ